MILLDGPDPALGP